MKDNMNGKVSWKVFACRFEDREQITFEELCYQLFCRKFDLKEGLHRFYNQHYIETDPARISESRVVGFQAKYFESKVINDNQKRLLKETIEKAAVKYPEMTELFFYITSEFSESSKPDQTKTDSQIAIEECAREHGIKLEWVMRSNLEVILQREEYRSIWDYYFNPDPAKAGRSPLSAEEEMSIISRINERLERQKKNHQSFRLLNDIVDETMLPQGHSIKLIGNRDRLIATDVNGILSFRQFIINSWKQNTQTHLFITGKGGIGKTVSLLNFATEKGFLPKNVAAVYIPLYELSSDSHCKGGFIEAYLQSSFGDVEYNLIKQLSFRPWDNGPSLILLLDGYNEIVAEVKNEVENDIIRWAIDRTGVQIVTTSRIDGLFNIQNIQRLELQDLSESIINHYLSCHGIEIPQKNHKIYDVISTPFMLSLYVGTSSLSDLLWGNECLIVKEPINPGSLIWNYCQRELIKCLNNDSEFDKIEYAMAILLTAPYICWKVELRSKTPSLSQREFLNYIEESCLYWLNRKKPLYFLTNFEILLGRKLENIDKDRLINSQYVILTKKTAIFHWSGQQKKYSLLHQNFRDGIAAIHLYNMAHSMDNYIPIEFSNTISSSITGYFADIIDDESLIHLWENNRIQKSVYTESIRNLLQIIYNKYEGDFTHFNFSGLNLCHINLFSLLSKNRKLSFPVDPNYYIGTQFNIGCFVPQENTQAVETVAYSQSGLIIAVGYYDGSICLWDAKSKNQIGKLMDKHTGSIRSLSFSPDCVHLVSGSDDSTIRIWNIETQQQDGKTLYGHTKGVSSVAYSPDGHHLVSGSDDGTVRIWDAYTHDLLVIKNANNNIRVSSVSYSPDGTRIAVGKHDGLIYIWDHYLKEYVYGPLRGHRWGAVSLLYSKDGKYIMSWSSDKTIRIWDADKPLQIGEPIEGHSAWIRSAAFFPDGLKLASCSDDRTIQIWDIETHERIGQTIIGHRDRVRSIAISPNGYNLVSGSDDGTVIIWDVRTRKIEHILLRNRRIAQETENTNESNINKINNDHNTDFSKKTTDLLKRKEGWMRTVVFNPTGEIIIGGSHNGTIRVWEAKTYRQKSVPLLGHDRQITSISCSLDGNCFISGSDDGTIRIWDTKTLKQIREPIKGHEGGVDSVAFSPDGNYFASGSRDGTVKVWKKETCTLLGTLQAGYKGRVLPIAFSPDGRVLANGTGNGKVKTWDFDSLTLVSSRSVGEDSRIRTIAFSPCGKLICTGSADGEIRIWKQDNQEPPFLLSGHKAGVTSVAFNPNGEIVISASYDNTIRIWSINTQKQLFEPIGENCEIYSVSFSKDGTRFVCGLGDGSIEIWDYKSLTCIEKINILYGIDLYGLDFSKAILSSIDRKILSQNGVIV